MNFLGGWWLSQGDKALGLGKPCWWGTGMDAIFCGYCACIRRNRGGKPAAQWAGEVKKHADEQPTNKGVDVEYYTPPVIDRRLKTGKKFFRGDRAFEAELGTPPVEIFSSPQGGRSLAWASSLFGGGASRGSRPIYFFVALASRPFRSEL